MAKEPTTLDDLKELLEDNIEVSEETNKLLKAMRRDAWIGGVVKTLLWLALIGLSFYFSIKFIEPLLGGAGEMGSQMNSENFKAILDLYQGNLPQ